MLTVNHYPIRSDLQIRRSSYRHWKPENYCSFLRHQGWHPHISDGHVVVYHLREDNPDDKRTPIDTEAVSPSGSREQYEAAVRAIVASHLCHAGLLLGGTPSRPEYISPSEHCIDLTITGDGSDLPQLAVQAHLRWTWDLEWHTGRLWIVPLPGRRILAAHPPTVPTMDMWLRHHLRDLPNLKAVDLQTGRHRPLHPSGDQWEVQIRDRWQPVALGDWRVSFSPKALRDLGYSEAAFHSAQFTFDQLEKAVDDPSPFSGLLAKTRPLSYPNRPFSVHADNHLQFHNGTGHDLKQVHSLGILEPPHSPVRLLVLAPDWGSSSRNQQTRNALNVHLAPQHVLRSERGQALRRSVGALPGADTIAAIWTSGNSQRGFRLPPFTLSERKLLYYEPRTGKLQDEAHLSQEADLAAHDGYILVSVVLVDDALGQAEHGRLKDQLHGIKHILLKTSTLLGGSRTTPKWINLTLQLAQRAGAVPWDLTDLPGVDPGTCFVGVDLGHSHATDRSNIAFTVLDHRGRPAACHVERCDRNNERIPTDVLHRTFDRLLQRRRGVPPTQVIVHRDGRYLDGEVDDIMDALHFVSRLSLVAIKKDTCTRLSGPRLEGETFQLSDCKTVLVTNTQSAPRAMPKPIEIELVHSDRLSMAQVVSQVFWLTRVYHGNAYFPTRLPATTEWADDIAATGRKLHLKGW